MASPASLRILRQPWLWGVVVLGIVIGFAFWRNPLALETERRLEKLRSAGIPTTPLEHDRWYAAVPEDENSATLLLDVPSTWRSLNDTNLPFLGRAKLPLRTQPFPPNQRAAMERLVTNHPSTFTAIHTALERPKFRAPINLSAGASTQLPHLLKLKQVANALAISACLAAEQGDAPRAVQALQDSVRLGQRSAVEPTLISGLVALGCESVALEATSRVLSARILSGPQLESLQRDLQSAGSVNYLGPGFLGQFALAYEVPKLSPRQMAMWFGNTGPGSSWSDDGLHEFKLWAYGSLKMTRRDYEFLLRVWDQAYEAYQLDYPKRFDRMATVATESETELGQHFLPMARMFYGNAHEHLVTEARAITLLRAAAMACGVERYKLAKGNLPESLDVLVPDYAQSVGQDPISGQPLRYRTSGQGYAVYGVGRDRRDDGGLEPSRDRKRSANPTQDWIFAVGLAGGDEPETTVEGR